MIGRGGWSEKTLAYFRSHGIAGDVASACGVVERDNSLRFPNTEPDGTSFWRERPLNGGKTRQPSGVPLVPWWPGGRATHAVSVLVTEGESDALAALTAICASRSRTIKGVAVVAVPGTGFPADRLAAQLAEFGFTNVWLGYDADDAGRKASERAKQALAARRITVRALRLPDGMDVADCLAAADDGALWLERALFACGAEEVDEDREAELLRKAGAMKRAGFHDTSIIVALEAENGTRQPVLDAEVVAKLARTIRRWKAPPLWLTNPVEFVDDDRLDHDERHLLLFLIQRLRANGTRQIGSDSLVKQLRLRIERVTAAKRGLVAHGRIEWKDAGSRPGWFRVLPWPHLDDVSSSAPPAGAELHECVASLGDGPDTPSASSASGVGRSGASSLEPVGSSVPRVGALEPAQ